MKINQSCIFCKIISRDAKAEILYEDDLVVAFLDIAPINRGHVLVIPKEHYNSSSALPEEIAGRLLYIGGRFGTACKRALDADGFNLHLADGLSAGQIVPHVHLHVIPRFASDGFHWNWRKLEIDSGEYNEIAVQIKSKLKVNNNK